MEPIPNIVIAGAAVVIFAAIVASIFACLNRNDRKRRDASASIEAPATRNAPTSGATRERTAYGPDKDAWETGHEPLGFSNALFRFHADFRLSYVDAGGQPSLRSVTIRAVHQWEHDDHALLAFCHLRDAHRTFLLSRVQELVYVPTGEVVRDPMQFFAKLDEESAERALERLVDRWGSVVKVLVFIGSADGQFRAVERGIAADVLVALQGDPRLSPQLVESHLDDAECSLREFRRSLRSLAPAEPATRMKVISAAEKIVGTQKTVHPIEAAALEELGVALKPVNS